MQEIKHAVEWRMSLKNSVDYTQPRNYKKCELQEMSTETSKMEIQCENDGEEEEVQNNQQLGGILKWCNINIITILKEQKERMKKYLK